MDGVETEGQPKGTDGFTASGWFGSVMTKGSQLNLAGFHDSFRKRPSVLVQLRIV